MSLYDRSNVKNQTRIGSSLLPGSDQKTSTQNLIVWILIAGLSISILLSAIDTYKLPDDFEDFYGSKFAFFIHKFTYFIGSNNDELTNLKLPIFLTFIKITIIAIFLSCFINNIKYLLAFCYISICAHVISFILFISIFPSDDQFIRMTSIEISKLSELSFYVNYITLIDFYVDGLTYYIVTLIYQYPTCEGDCLALNVEYSIMLSIIVNLLSAIVYGTMAFFLRRSMKEAEVL